MTYGFAISQQLELLLYSLGFGFFLGFIYRLIMTVRTQAGGKKSAVVFFDILFSVIATVAEYCFLLIYADGQIRLVALAANAAGFAFYRITVDFAVKKVIAVPVRAAVTAVRLIFKPFTGLAALGKKYAGVCMERIKAKRTAKPKDKTVGKRKKVKAAKGRKKEKRKKKV